MSKVSKKIVIGKFKIIFSIKIEKNYRDISRSAIKRLENLINKNKKIKNIIHNFNGSINFFFEEGVVLIDEDVVIDIIIKYFERNLILKIHGGIHGSVPSYVKINKCYKKY